MMPKRWLIGVLVLVVLLTVANAALRIRASRLTEQECLDRGGDPAMCYAVAQAIFYGR
jgi:hypothetical protein